MNNKKQKVLILDPFLGHSHKSFWNAVKGRSKHDIEIYPFNDSNWKLASGLSGHVVIDSSPDVFLCSDYFDISVFKALNPSLADVPFICYFHENQFEYPVQLNRQTTEQRDMHYGLINYRNVLLADRVIFNSKWNHDSFIRGLKNFRRRLPAKFRNDIDIKTFEEKISESSTIFPLTEKIEIIKSNTNKNKNKTKSAPLKILWNHRWEFDKGTDELIELYKSIIHQDMDVHLNVCGKNHNNSQLADRLQDISRDKVTIKDWVEDGTPYIELIQQSDVILSTSKHEFFGLSVLEGILAGLVPLLPNALSYPELYADIFTTQSFYCDHTDLTEKIIALATQKRTRKLPKNPSSQTHERFSLLNEIKKLDNIIDQF